MSVRTKQTTSALIALVLVVTVLAWASAALGRCPLGAIATHSTFVGGALGSIAVETCVTRSGGEDTYTYTVTDLSARTPGFCSFAVAGIGVLSTVAQAAPSGWTGVVLPAGSCASWWAWSTIGFGSPLPPPHGLIPGGSAVFSMTVNGPTTPAEVSAQIQSCGGKPVSCTVLGPSACPEIEEASYEATCACTPRGGCTAIELFEGDGTRIQVIGGPDTQVLMQCDPSWVRHGFLGPDLSPSEVEFRLWIDGSPVPLTMTEMCMPGDEPGQSVITIMWHAQFPPSYFTIGTHEVTGEWEVFDTPDTDPFVWSRTMTLEVVLCPIPLPSMPITILPTLPDITLELVRDSCSCEWTPLQEYVCELEVVVDVANIGAEPTGLFHVSMEADSKETDAMVASLQPGQERRVTLDLSWSYRKPGFLPSFDYTVTADCMDAVEESDEANNSLEGDVTCQ